MVIRSYLHGDKARRYGWKSRNIRKEIRFPTVVNHKTYGWESQDMRRKKRFSTVMRYKRCGRKIFSPYYIRGRKRKKGMGG